MLRKRIAVIGGGAAGMTAAITAAGEGGQVTIYEHQERLGKKILSTGNGKCNLGNRELSASQYSGGDEALLEDCFKKFGTDDTIHFFEDLGLLIKDKNGYLYPACEQASAVLDVLRSKISTLGVHVETGIHVDKVKQGRSGELLVHSGQKCEGYDRVIIACGGRAASKTGSDGSGYKIAGQMGHSLTPVVPALTSLLCQETYCKAIAGVRADAQISVYDGRELTARERGELQLTDYGISGIPVFQLSGKVNRLLADKKKLRVEIDFLPDYGEEAFAQMISRRAALADGRTTEEFFTGILHKKLMILFIKLAGLHTNEAVSQVPFAGIHKVYGYLRCFPLHITGSKSFDNAQICAGGVKFSEITAGLESRKLPGVYFAGEIMDIDGRCGGYNLQWAWTSGYITAMNAMGVQF